MTNQPHLVTPVILSGGSGTRLWPLSRTGFPKQFLVLSGTRSLFQQAVKRVNGLSASDIVLNETLVVTNEEHRFLALDQLREMPEIRTSLLLEPMVRNTAPALTFAALQAIQFGDDPILVVTPADQTVQNEEAFTTALQNSIRAAASGSVVILGISPDRPETGFGYIKRGGSAGPYQEFKVSKFVEKPNLETVQAYLATGDYSWNGGIFVVRATVWLQALNTFNSTILVATQAAFDKRTQDASFIRPNPEKFSSIPQVSVDYAVIEKCPDSEFPIKVVTLEAGWNDLGGWDAVWQSGKQDKNGNVFSGDTVLHATTNSLVQASHRLVGTVGVSNLIVIETADAVLVADRSQSQQVREIVTQLEKQSREERIHHRKVARPWGWSDTIDSGAYFKVKRIQVNPGASLSLQKHTKRAEHWVVVKGIAEVTCGDQVLTLKENQSTYIPLGEKHRLANPGKVTLEIIEVQSGTYLGEDDIERFEDSYGRSEN